MGHPHRIARISVDSPLPHFRRFRAAQVLFTWSLFVCAACSGNDKTSKNNSPNNTGGTSAGGSTSIGNSDGLLKSFNPPSDPGGGALLFAASGEVLALTGFPFPPADPSDPAFVDGWDVKFTHLLVTVDKITVSDNPDTVPGDESKTGAVVAKVDGPWAIDLARKDTNNLPGKGGAGEQAVPFASLSTQNANGNTAFLTDGTRYAFGFDTIAATRDAVNVNLDDSALAEYQDMIDQQCTVLYDGTATFQGAEGPIPECANDTTATNYSTWPQTIHFYLCFKTPTTYINCQNPDNDPASPLDGEEHERGIALQSSVSTVAQLTFHTGHPFWDSVVHDSPPHFDQFAAQASNSDASIPTVTLDDLQGVDYTAVTDAAGKPLQWRYCMEPRTEVHAKFTGAMAFDPSSVPHAVNGDPTTGLRDYRDFATYNQSTQGHLNGEGLCFVKRNYPSPQ